MRQGQHNAAPQCGNRSVAAFTRHPAAGELPRRIGYWHDVDLVLPGLTRDATRDAIRTAAALAQHYTRIDFYRTAHRDSALIQFMLGPPAEFDGPDGTLALADMRSLYDPEPREVWLDPAEQWSDLAAGRAEIYALPVLCHEIGHTLGFGHSARCGLMSPYYDPAICTPAKAELRRFWREYPQLKPEEA